MPMNVTLRRLNVNDWTNLSLIIDNAHMEYDGTIVESSSSLFIKFDAETAFNILMQLTVAMSDERLTGYKQFININDKIYKMDTKYWHPLYRNLVDWNDCRNEAEELQKEQDEEESTSNVVYINNTTNQEVKKRNHLRLVK